MIAVNVNTKEPQNQIYMLTSGQNMKIIPTIVNSVTSRVTGRLVLKNMLNINMKVSSIHAINAVIVMNIAVRQA